MSGVTNMTNVTAATATTLGSSGSLQFRFAALQLALSQLSKNSALDYMQKIQDSQDEQKQIAAMLQEVRNLQENGSDTHLKLRDNHVLVSYDTAKYMVDNGMAVAGDIEVCKNLVAMDLESAKAENADLMGSIVRNGLQVPKDKLDILAQSLQAKLDTVGTDTQQLMIYVQDFMGQYNSYLQGSNSVIQQANATLGELARSR